MPLKCLLVPELLLFAFNGVYCGLTRKQTGIVNEKEVFMKSKLFRKTLSCFMAVSLAAGICGIVPASEPESPKKVVDYFRDPDMNARPMARMWFPDAAAGEDDNDYIEKQILELADKGFGGVEVAMLADGVSYGNEDGRTYGWGTEAWSKLLKKVLKAAAKVPGGFQVDMTITAHWPPTLDTIDPNDEAANKEISYSLTRLSPSDLENGKVEILLPEQKTDGPATGFGGARAYDHFLFTDTFISAALVKVSDVTVTPGEEGQLDQILYSFDFESMQPITERVTEIEGAGYAAGVPDKETAEQNGWDYDAICDFFGPESDGPFTLNNGKLDENRNRKRMADWQNEYEAGLEGITLEGLTEAEDISAGDWLILSTFYRGTGQSTSGGRIMHNGAFVTNYYNEAGTAAVTDYWDQMLENDPELKELMEANPGYIFEDSIESSSVSSYWASTMMDDIADDYEYKEILPIIAASKYISSGFMGVTVTDYFSFTGDDGLVSRIYEDYNDKLADLYVKYRVNGMTEWTKDSLGWGFRGQTYHLPGLEIGRAAMLVDVPECDNMSKGDGIRYQSGTMNLTDRDYLTMEAMTGPFIGYATMDDVLTELGQNYSDGVTRAILHGTPYTKTFNGYNSDWPGWLPFGPSMFGSSYTYREAYWKDFSNEVDYMSRIQAVLQNGDAKIDLAVLIDKESTFDFESGNRFQQLLDNGWSYNLVSESVLDHENAVVTEGRLAADGPGYKALIVDEVSMISSKGLDRILQYAEDGLPIIVLNSNINRVYGSELEEDAAVTEKFASLLEMDNVVKCDSAEELDAALSEAGISSYADYDAAQLETTLYVDPEDGTSYYYVYNNAFPENSGMMGNNQGTFYKGEDKAVKNAELTFAGEGTVYRLDPHTGMIYEAADAKDNGDGTVTFTLDCLYGGDSTIFAVSTDAEAFADAQPEVKKEESSLEAIDLTGEAWNLVIDSYGPDDASDDPAESKITTEDMGTCGLGKWADLDVSKEILDSFGVEDMKYVSGTGTYTLTFDVPETWGDSTGSVLAVSYGKDQIGSIIVNGTALTPNNASDHVDLGTLLVPGENTLEIRLNTSLYGRTFVENSGYEGAEFGMNPEFMGPIDPDAYYNGLLEVQVQPYSIAK